MNKDQEILEEMYLQMYDEGIVDKAKSFGKKAALAGAGLGLAYGGLNAGMDKLIDDHYKDYSKEQSTADTTLRVSKGLKNDNEVLKIVSQYLKDKKYGKNPRIQNGYIIFDGTKGESHIDLSRLKAEAIQKHILGKVDGLSGYLAQHL